MMVNNTIKNINNNLNKLDSTYEKMATGMKYNRPSDDPIAATYGMKLTSDISEVEQYQKNVDDALSYSQVTESAVMEMKEVLQKARELTVQAANGTNTPDDTQKIAAEMEQLRDQLIQIGNSTYMDDYIFSGYNSDQPLFTDDGQYNVDMTTKFINDKPAKEYQVGAGTEIKAGVNGLDLFGYEQLDSSKYIKAGEDIGDAAIVGPGVTFTDDNIKNGDFNNMEIYVEYNGASHKIVLGEITDVANDGFVDDLQTELNNQFGSIFLSGEVKATINTATAPNYSINVHTAGAVGSDETLKVDVVQANESSMIKEFDELIEAMKTGDSDGMQKGLDNIDNHIDTTLAALADIGAKSNGMELTENRLDENYVTLTTLYSKTAEIDYAEATMEMQMQENVYQASLSVGAMVIQPTLVDFIK